MSNKIPLPKAPAAQRPLRNPAPHAPTYTRALGISGSEKPRSVFKQVATPKQKVPHWSDK